MNIIWTGTEQEQTERHMNNKVYLSWSDGLKGFDRKPSTLKSGLQRQWFYGRRSIDINTEQQAAVFTSQGYHSNTLFETVLHLLKTNFNIFTNHVLYTKLITISFLSGFNNTMFNPIWLFFQIVFYSFCISKTELSLYLEKSSGMESSSFKGIGWVGKSGFSKSIQGVPFLSFQIK